MQIYSNFYLLAARHDEEEMQLTLEIRLKLFLQNDSQKDGDVHSFKIDHPQELLVAMIDQKFYLHVCTKQGNMLKLTVYRPAC